MTSSELDMLCQQYLDCELSRLQEGQLHLVLSHTGTELSPLARKTLALMEIEHRMASLEASRPVRRPLALRPWLSAAASVAMVLAVAGSIFMLAPEASGSPDTVQYTAWVGGRQLPAAEAEALAKKQQARMDGLLAKAERPAAAIDAKLEKLDDIPELTIPESN